MQAKLSWCQYLGVFCKKFVYKEHTLLSVLRSNKRYRGRLNKDIQEESGGKAFGGGQATGKTAVAGGSTAGCARTIVFGDSCRSYSR